MTCKFKCIKVQGSGNNALLSLKICARLYGESAASAIGLFKVASDSPLFLAFNHTTPHEIDDRKRIVGFFSEKTAIYSSASMLNC